MLHYLLADSRRLAVGDIWDEHRVSATLIAAVVPALGNQDARRLEDAIVGWRWLLERSEGSRRQSVVRVSNDARENTD